MFTVRTSSHRLLIAVCVATMLGPALPACAQKPDDVTALKKEIETLKASQAEMRKDLDEIKSLLKPAPTQAIINAPKGLTAPVAGAPATGSASAAIVLIEFSDYECPFCGRFFKESYQAIARDFVQTGKVRHLFRAFPLESIHKNAFKAHEAALCAGVQGKFWQMHDRLFSNQKAIGPNDITGYAQAIGLDATAFAACLASGKMAEQVRADIDAGTKMGISGTPFFLIGKPTANGDIEVLKGISGAHPYEVFKQAFDDVTAGK
jgi:protein-disulfide isomerase